MIRSKLLTKIISLLLVVLMLCAMTACGTKDLDENTAYVEDEEVLNEYNETKAAEVYGSFASEVEALYEEENPSVQNEDDTVQNEYDITYLGWTYFEYATAKEAEKDGCAKAYLGYIGDLLGLKVGEPDAETLESVKEALSSALKNNEELSVKEIVLYFYASEDTGETAE